MALSAGWLGNLAHHHTTVGPITVHVKRRRGHGWYWSILHVGSLTVSARFDDRTPHPTPGSAREAALRAALARYSEVTSGLRALLGEEVDPREAYHAYLWRELVDLVHELDERSGPDVPRDVRMGDDDVWGVVARVLRNAVEPKGEAQAVSLRRLYRDGRARQAKAAALPYRDDREETR